MRIATKDERDAAQTGGKKDAQVAPESIAEEKDSVGSPSRNFARECWIAQAKEMVRTGFAGGIADESVGIAAEQVDIPLNFPAKTGICLRDDAKIPKVKYFHLCR